MYTFVAMRVYGIAIGVREYCVDGVRCDVWVAVTVGVVLIESV